jgi:hypothetical protein
VPRRPKQETAVAKIAALESLDGFASLEGYQDAVSATLPRGTKVSEIFWFELEATLNTFLRWERRRLRHPPLAERVRWQRMEGLATALIDDLFKAHLQTPRTYSDPNWAKPALNELKRLRARARSHIKAYDAIVKGYEGRRNTSRQFLYAGILDLWTKHLRQRLAYSRTPKGAPGGPLIRFFSACVDPYMGDEAPTVQTIAGIIDRAR